ncbi:spore cortex-lytic protein [Pseudoflavonifractor phocaeensis]|uniref:spore cortex-lytic protein n=1 Tax=Pseudoflavonifractor phocaeensis TaxID=1870988 RepID=UPI00195A8BFE|nr:spore cortex-lytic protein [Pseudoflavonifractor phocaeensis]MBM6869749.1 spore cortex-lytic protein [Pseudoflavonifractor phocaeensis]
MASIGTIAVRVFTSVARIPIQGATVAFTQGGFGGRQTLLAVRVTDQNGHTVPVRIATPDLAEGASPSGETPFATCNIWTEAPGYEYSVSTGVQIFPGVETVQDIALIPLPEHTQPNPDNTQFSYTTPQTL